MRQTTVRRAGRLTVFLVVVVTITTPVLVGAAHPTVETMSEGQTVAQSDGVDIRHDPSSSGGSKTKGPDGKQYVSEDIRVEVRGDDSVVFGGSSLTSLRITNPENNKSVTLEPLDDEQTHLVTAFEIDIDSGETNQLVSDVVSVEGPTVDGSSAVVNVSIRGETDLFTDRIFTPHTVEIVGATGDVVASTGEATIATGYGYDIEYNGSALGVTRADEVKEDWYVAFRQGFFSDGETIEREINHTDSDEMFVVPTDDIDFDENETFDIEIKRNESDPIGDRLALLFRNDVPEPRNGPIADPVERGGEDGPDGDLDGTLTATREIATQTVPANGSTTVTVTAEAGATSGDLRIIESLDPGLEVSVVDDNGATVTEVSNGVLAASWDGVSEAAITYEVTLPEDAAAGTTFDISGIVEARDAGNETSPGGETRIEVGEPDPVLEYADPETGRVGSTGLLDAAADFRSGEIGSETLLDVAAAFRSGDPVTE